MTREIITASLKTEVFNRFNSKCYVCGYALKPVLRVHHMIPVSLGGADNLENLTLLCGNCHTLTHFYSSKKYQGKEISSFLAQELSKDSKEKLKSLIAKIQQAKAEVEKNGNLWLENGQANQIAYEMGKAIESIGKRNKFSMRQKELLTKALGLILQHIPDDAFEKASYRLLDKGRCISINLMNYLIFRSPAYGDLGEKPKYDCYTIFPSNLNELQSARHETHKSSWRFKHLDCVSLHLSYTELLDFDENDWILFKKACQIANDARKTRNWISNIKVAKNHAQQTHAAGCGKRIS